MTIETAEDRATFLAEFGVPVTWPGATEPFLGIFDRPTIMADGLGEVSMIDRDASLLVQEGDLPPSAAEDDQVSIEGEVQAYRCRSIRPDGAGFAIVDLKKA